MRNRCRQLLYYWAYLDLQHTCDRKNTYFWTHAEDIGRKNLTTVRYVSAFSGFICAFVVAVATFLGAPAGLCIAYGILLLGEILQFMVASSLLKKPRSNQVYTVVTSICLLHLLVFGAYIGTVQSPDESASIFLVALLLSQILFTMPPVITTAFSAVVTVAALLTSHQIKTDFFFRIDLLNCTGVFLISILVGWLVNKMRVEEATARTRVQQLNSELQHLSEMDQLTNLPNHRNFQETYYAAFEASRQAADCIGVIMMDIDQFKAYNDNYGHIEGDRCLSEIGGVLRAFVCEDVYICRFGGEEFLALLRNAACARAVEIAEHIRTSVQGMSIPHAFSRVTDVVTISAGVYVGVPGPVDLPMRFVDRADRAMYQSKADGGNRLTNFVDVFA